MFHQPTRRLGTEPDSTHENEGGNESGTELKTPRYRASVFDNDIGAEAQEDAYNNSSVHV